MGIRDIFKRSDEPSNSSKMGYFMTEDAKSLLVGGYTRLSDSPEVLTAVNTVADLVSNMTIQLMENGDKGDIRGKNDLSRLVDIKPNQYQTRKSFIFWIVKSIRCPITRSSAGTRRSKTS